MVSAVIGVTRVTQEFKAPLGNEVSRAKTAPKDQRVMLDLLEQKETLALLDRKDLSEQKGLEGPEGNLGFQANKELKGRKGHKAKQD